MNTDTNEGKWKQIKGEFKEEYGKITKNESTEAEGSFDKLVGKIQEKYGETREKIEKEIKSW
ncbi:CsbD family protein [Polaribacter aestuariivivens]|uniref:CsbD family protein n=1 Tax=Polaribacter aestuariivivens TaxID=2304626 RepID=A0A5S3N9J3_9FLAO|nr:CsbD family protein [Polaribacter aestuariivivens]TMM31174.1 CsbD family protein [Polaribacter aestuariivivens]